MPVFLAENKWKMIALLAVLFTVASMYLYSTDPGFVTSPEVQQMKASFFAFFQ